MLENCCSFKLRDVLIEMASKCRGKKEPMQQVMDRLTKALEIADLNVTCVGRVLTKEEAEEVRASQPAVAFYLQNDSRRNWFLCSLEPVKTSSGIVHSVAIEQYESRKRISSPHWANAGGTDPDKFIKRPSEASLKVSPCMKDFFDHRPVD